jgi:C-terminal processing protease CtpA/Prc
MYLKPIAGAVDDLDTFDRSGMWVNASADGLKVIDVTKGGPAEAAGLHKDDVITAVDGKPAGTLFLPDLRKHLRTDAPGTVVTLAIKGKGNVKLTLRDLI